MHTEDTVHALADVYRYDISLDAKEWKILPAKVRMGGGDIKVDGIEIASGEQRIRLAGETSRSQKDTMTLSLERFNISGINHLTKSDLGINGNITG